MSARGRVRVEFVGSAASTVRVRPPDGSIHLHVPDLLADGLGPARATLAAALDRGAVARVRANAAEVLRALEPSGRRRLEAALGMGDVAAARMLGARDSAVQELVEGESAWEAEAPFGEPDALAVLDAVGVVGALYVTGIECALLGGSLHGPALLSSMRPWLAALLSGGADVCFRVWTGAQPALRRWDPAVARPSEPRPWARSMRKVQSVRQKCRNSDLKPNGYGWNS